MGQHHPTPYVGCCCSTCASKAQRLQLGSWRRAVPRALLSTAIRAGIRNFMAYTGFVRRTKEQTAMLATSHWALERARPKTPPLRPATAGGGAPLNSTPYWPWGTPHHREADPRTRAPCGWLVRSQAARVQPCCTAPSVPPRCL